MYGLRNSNIIIHHNLVDEIDPQARLRARPMYSHTLYDEVLQKHRGDIFVHMFPQVCRRFLSRHATQITRNVIKTSSSCQLQVK